MELLYNPTLMSEAEIKATFVARQGLVDELLQLVTRQPEGAGVQHVVVIAPRGMGKTTTLLMTQFGLADQSLLRIWQVVRFCEESYGINDLADFWLEAVKLLAADTRDMDLLRCGDELHGSYPESDDLHEAAFTLLKDWARSHGKRLLLLVDNLDLILEQINDERDNARLRDVLMNDGTLMLIGTASAYFREARAYDRPLYNFFKIHHLDPLQPAEIRQLLRGRAAADGKPNLEDFLEKNPARLRVLEHFTGGNPRLVLLLYRVVVRSEVTEVLHGLEKLLDEVTPYYKAKIESLPPQQRKILDHIAQVSGQTWEGVTPTDIARATRLRPNQVSAQLKRLSELGYVRAADLRERASWYTLSEPLYALYHQMRFGRAARQKMQWLVNFMKVWYQAEELLPECERLACIFREKVCTGHLREACEALEFRRCLVEAMAGSPSYWGALDSIIRDYLQLPDRELLKRELSGIDLARLSDETLGELLEADHIGPEEFLRARGVVLTIAEAQQLTEVVAAFRLGVAAAKKGQREVALQHFDRCLELRLDNDIVHVWRAHVLLTLGRAPEALASAERALELVSDEFPVAIYRALALTELGRHEEALESFDSLLGVKPEQSSVWTGRAVALKGLGRREEAATSFGRALELEPGFAEAWLWRGEVLAELGRHEEALACYDRTLEKSPGDASAWFSRGIALGKLDRFQEALDSLERVLTLQPGNAHAWFNRALLVEKLRRPEEAVLSYDRGLELKPDEHRAWLRRGGLLGRLGRHDQAITSIERALAIRPEDAHAWSLHGVELLDLGRPGEALTSFDHALRIDTACVAARLGKMYVEVVRGHEDFARNEWRETLQHAKPLEQWRDQLTSTLISFAAAGHLGFARELIAESGLEEQLFPLARALDYLLTGDEALIEKLSPEVRGIVEEIIKKLGPPKQAPATEVRRKRGSGPRHRIRKQLR